MTWTSSGKFVLVYLVGLGIAQPLAAQTVTTAVAVSDSRINVSWRDNSTRERGFELHRSASGMNGPFTAVARAAPGATTFSDVGLDPSTQYCYKVRAVFRPSSWPRYSRFSQPACATTTATPGQPGNIRISTTTSGFDLDVDGYLLQVNSVAGTPIHTNGTVTVARLTAGQHTVTLYGLGSNCSVQGANPRSVAVKDGATTEVPFAVRCGAGPTVVLTTVTTGSNIDADGYGVLLWRRITGGRMLGAGQSGGVPANGSLRLFGLTTGEYDFEIIGIASNCMQMNTLPMVDLTYGGSVAATLNVLCAPVAPGVEVCENGLDDDGDGLVDSADPDCQLVCQYGDCMAGPCGPGFVCEPTTGCCYHHCGDGQMNGTEGDVDCGGDCVAKCQTGQHCWGNFDCASGVCSNDRCQ